jgi:hypothetical protein
MKFTFIIATLAATLALPAFAGGETPSNPDAVQYIVSPEDGATVTSPVTVVFGLKGMGVAPAGVEQEMTGHHHLIIDEPKYGEGADDDLSLAIPADETHKHFGGGQTETSIELTPGEHTLQLVLGDYAHVPHDTPIMSDVITITVE